MEVIIEIQSHPEGAPRSFTVSLSTENSSAGMHNYYIYTSMFVCLHFYLCVGQEALTLVDRVI